MRRCPYQGKSGKVAFIEYGAERKGIDETGSFKGSDIEAAWFRSYSI
jgi:hypothetical protein